MCQRPGCVPAASSRLTMQAELSNTNSDGLRNFSLVRCSRRAEVCLDGTYQEYGPCSLGVLMFRGAARHTHRRARRYAHAHTNTNAHKYSQARTRTYTCTRTNIQAHARAHIQMSKHTGTHTRTYKSTHVLLVLHLFTLKIFKSQHLYFGKMTLC